MQGCVWVWVHVRHCVSRGQRTTFGSWSSPSTLGSWSQGYVVRLAWQARLLAELSCQPKDLILIKEEGGGGWRDGSLVKNTYCSSTGPEFCSQHPNQVCTTIYNTPFWPFQSPIRTWHILTQALLHTRKGKKIKGGMR